jgi:hypothetical protein
MVKSAPSVSPTRRPLEQEERVGIGIAKREELGRGREDEVQRVDRDVPDDPADRGDDARADVAAVAADLVGDQREKPLRVVCP